MGIVSDRVAEVARAGTDADRNATAEHPAVAQAKRSIVTARRKIERHLAALEAGVDSALIAERTKQAQADVAAAQLLIDNAPDMPDPLTEAEVLGALTALREPRHRRHRAESRRLSLARHHTGLPPRRRC